MNATYYWNLHCLKCKQSSSDSIQTQESKCVMDEIVQMVKKVNHDLQLCHCPTCDFPTYQRVLSYGVSVDIVGTDSVIAVNEGFVKKE